MATNILSAQSLSRVIAQSLPPEAEQQLKSPYDAIAVAVHAALIAVGFRLTGLSEDERLPQSSRAPELPSEWNAQSPSSYSFVYAHSQSAMQFLLRVNRMGGKAVVTAMAIGDDKPVTFDVKVDEYISSSSLPARPVTEAITRPSETTMATEVEVPQSVLTAIQSIFISTGRLSDLANLVRIQQIQKLLPSLRKEGYEDSPLTGVGPSPSNVAPRPAHHEPPTLPRHDPLRMPPRHPFPTGDFPPPGFDDEYDLQRPPRPRGDYGRSDLYPAGLGPNDPFHPMGPNAPLRPGGSGGMHPTFDDPLFAGQGRRPDGQAPPGARWDPTGPGGGPRGPGGFPGGGGNPFGGYGSGDFI